MKKIVLITFVIFSIFKVRSQDKILISETENIKIFETNLSLESNGNVWPTIYNEGLIFSSNKRNNKYFFTDFKLYPTRFKTSSKNTTGPFAIFNSEIYFTGLSKSKINLAVYKGKIDEFGIIEAEELPILKLDFSYADPAISKDGNRMIVVANEKGFPHILELIRNRKNEWEKGSVIYISNPQFEILSATIFDENTIYFSSNASSGKIEEVLYTLDNGKFAVSEFVIEKSSFNIYKTIRNNGIWQLPVKVSMFNSEFDDLGVVFKTPKSGYLNSFRYNNSDNIYYFELKH